MTSKLFALLLAAVAVSGCSWLPAVTAEPVGVGRGKDEFPKSPCACGPEFFRDGRWS